MKRNRNKEVSKNEENEGTEDKVVIEEMKKTKNQNESFGLNISKTMLIFTSEIISLGLIKSSHDKEISTKLTEFLIGFLQIECKK